MQIGRLPGTELRIICTGSTGVAFPAGRRGQRTHETERRMSPNRRYPRFPVQVAIGRMLAKAETAISCPPVWELCPERLGSRSRQPATRTGPWLTTETTAAISCPVGGLAFQAVKLS